MNIIIPLILVGLLAVGLGWWSINNSTDPSINENNVARSPSVKTETGELPSKIEDKTGKALDLSNKGLTVVPAQIFTQTTLTELNLSNNALSGALQGEIRFLQNLKTLDLSDNQFSGVPAEIGQLKMLEVLDLSNNQLTGLPNELGNLSNLKRLILTGNDYSESDLADIKKNLSSSTIVTVN